MSSTTVGNRASRSLRSSNSEVKSSYWINVENSLGPSSKLTSIQTSINEKESEHGPLNLGTTAIKPIKKGTGKIESRKGNLKSSATLTRNTGTRKRDIRKKKSVSQRRSYVLPAGSFKPIKVTEEERKHWRPLSTEIQSRVLDIVSQSTSMVEGNIKAVKDRRKLAQVLASMKIGLGKALAPPTGSSVASAEISPSTPIVAEEPEDNLTGSSSLSVNQNETMRLQASKSDAHVATSAVGEKSEWDSKESFISYVLDLLQQERSFL